jgi:1-acyl-sn-glycerol-3-phosphate acyltransferase
MPTEERFTSAYRAVMAVTGPIVRRWGRLEATGVELIPESGPLLIAGNHDSYWDPIAIGVAARERRQIRALAKSSMWKYPLVGSVLTGMGQIPIERGKADAAAMGRAIEELRAGACIGVFPEGTRSLGRELRARSGFGRLAEAVPEAEIISCICTGTVDVPRFPKRPSIRIEFFRPAGGGFDPEEGAAGLSIRLLAEIRERAPRVAAGRGRKARSRERVAAGG